MISHDAGRPITRTPAHRRAAPPIEWHFTPPVQRTLPPPILMPIGRYKGREVASIEEVGYLCWLLKKQVIRSPRVAAEVERVHDGRCGEWHAPERDEEDWR